MKAKAKTRIKQLAQVGTPQNRDECAADINEIGRLSRLITTKQAAMNDKIAAITDAYTQEFTPLLDEIKLLKAGVQSWCEAHRDDLTDGGRTKTGAFVSGTVQWRQRPPSVSVFGMTDVIENLKRLGLERFVRTKEELNKEAVLNDPEAVRGIAGLKIKTGVEDFVIEPFEQEAT
jgi:phage host-nuclease inhibitor protein Gam